jgi:serine/threonine-protein kinase
VLDAGVVDPRADVWSLGAVLFLLVTGAPPFAEGTPSEVLGAIATRSPEALRARLRDVPGPLADAILRCLEPDRDRRFVDVAELAEALVPYGTGTRTEGARRARAALTPAPPSFVTTMPVQVILAGSPPPALSPSPPPPQALPYPAPEEMPGFEAPTLAFNPTPHAAMLVPMATPHPMDVAPFPLPSLAPPPAVVPTTGPSGTIVAIVAALLTVAIGGAVLGFLVFRARASFVAEPASMETSSPPAASSSSPPEPAPVPASAAAPPPTETASAAPSEAPSAAPSSAPSAEASAAPPPAAPPPAVVYVAPATTPPRETSTPPIPVVAPVLAPPPRRPNRSDVLRSRE